MIEIPSCKYKVIEIPSCKYKVIEMGDRDGTILVSLEVIEMGRDRLPHECENRRASQIPVVN